MPQGEFHNIRVEDISINREGRQRHDIGDVSGLADSIRRLGLIHPIVITKDYVLVAGERRTAAVRSLGWTHIPAQFEDEIDPRILKLIELEENTKRLDLSWQEINDAMVAAYELYREIEPQATDEEISNYMRVSKGNLSSHLLVKRERSVNPEINKLVTFKTARDTTQRLVDRRRNAELIYIVRPSNDIYHPIQCTDFNTWAETYSGSKFNFIHCDFPYGIDSQDSGVNPSGYDDSLGVFETLLDSLQVYLDRFCAEQAHMIFWFSPKHWSYTQTRLQGLLGFQWDEVPLIWHKSDGKGIAPDQQRRPRRVYETAFFGWRGDAKLVHLKDNLFSAPSVSGRHPHEKSEFALRHFFELCVDENTAILDPTCGSGSALRAAHALGARRYLGLEQNKDYADDALYLFNAAAAE